MLRIPGFVPPLLVLALLISFASAPPGRSQDAPADFNRKERQQLRAIFGELQTARSAIASAEERLLDLLLSHGSDPTVPVDPPVDPVDPPTLPPVEPPVKPPPTDPTSPPIKPPPPGVPVPPPVDTGMDGAPDRVDPVRPTDLDAHVYANGTYRLVLPVASGEPTLGESTAGMASDAYAAVDAAMIGPGVIILGIHGNVGRVSMGYSYNSAPDLFHDKDPIGIQVAFVGQDEPAAVGPVFLGRRGADVDKFDPVDSAGFFSVGINGDPDPYAFRQAGYCREIVFDEVWIIPNAKHIADAGMHRSAFLFHKDWESLTLKGYQPRGMRMEEHVAYLQGGGFTQILDCNLFGGRRSGFQERPHQDSIYPSPPRHGAFVADGNWAEGFGWNHEKESGAQWLTVWTSLEYPVRISNNSCIDARYGCLGISKGTLSSEPYLTEDGWSHTNVYVWGNTFENKRARRACVTFTDVETIHIGGGNDFTGPDLTGHAMTFGTWWADKYADAKQPGAWLFYGEEALPTWATFEYQPDFKTYRIMTNDELAQSLVLPE